MVKTKFKGIITISLALSMSMGALPFIGRLALASNMDSTEDKTKPVVDHAYVENRKLKLSISDDYELGNKPIIYKTDKEKRFYEIDIDDYENEYDGKRKAGKVYEIDVEIPSVISIIILDEAGNQGTYKFTIKQDNVALTKYVPDFVEEKLADARQSEVGMFEGYDDILELEYGKVVNGLSLYDEIIEDTYTSYNKEDIKFKIKGLSMDKDGNIKLDKYGVFKVAITHSKDKTFEETAYILIKPDWSNIEDRRMPSNVSPYIVYSDKIKIADYFRYEDEVNKKNRSKIDASYMLVYDEDAGQAVMMDEQINLDLNKVYRLKVIHFENNTVQYFYIMRQEKPKTTKKNFADIDKNHWASKDINSLVSSGLLSGYPDGTYNPSGNITVKEFMTILARKITISSNPARPVVGNVTVPFIPGSWGYIESKSILDRIPSSDLLEFNYFNLDRPISREEVAFLLDKSLDFGREYNPNLNKPLIDAAISMYPSELTRLVDLGLIAGYPDGTFRPQNNITRAEIASLFARIK